MRPLGFDEREQLRYARQRAAELRHDWQMANGPSRHDGEAPRAAATSAGLISSARSGAGRTLIGLGTMLLPRREPCA
jgi:hypothetical protein